MSSNYKKLIKYIASTLGIATVAVIAYSPGLLALRLTDLSILRATMSIMTGVLLTGGFGYSTYRFILPDKKQIKTLTAKIDITELASKLKKHTEDEYMGKLSAQALAQIDRLNKSIERVEFEIARKFEPSSMTYKQFYSSVSGAGGYAFENLNSFANRLQLYNDEEYLNLQHYKEDDIPDEIQEQQIALMDKNFDLGRDALAANEKLILGLDSLAMELASANFKADAEGNSDMLNEINDLTNKIKYYI